MAYLRFQYTFTVFTPAFNRAHLLPRVYASLQQQTFRDFEWLVVDDGSTDNTRKLVQSWVRQADFPIHYVWQMNQGKHVAYNRATTEARGELFLTLDSDDWCVPEALERLKYHWDSIPEGERNHFSAVTVLCIDRYGRVLGDPFPVDALDSTPFELLTRFGTRGDKWGFQRTTILKEYPFPTIPGETYMPEGVLWNRIGQRYKTRYINDKLKVVEYNKDGLTASANMIRRRNPLGACLYYQEFICLPISTRLRITNLASYLRFAFHARKRPRQMILESGWPIWAIILLPFGYAAYRWDELRTRLDSCHKANGA